MLEPQSCVTLNICAEVRWRVSERNYLNWTCPNTWFGLFHQTLLHQFVMGLKHYLSASCFLFPFLKKELHLENILLNWVKLGLFLLALRWTRFKSVLWWSLCFFMFKIKNIWVPVVLHKVRYVWLLSVVPKNNIWGDLLHSLSTFINFLVTFKKTNRKSESFLSYAYLISSCKNHGEFFTCEDYIWVNMIKFQTLKL